MSARRVAVSYTHLDVYKRQLHAKDALAAHVRDELGISEHTEAKPLVAAAASAATFAPVSYTHLDVYKRQVRDCQKRKLATTAETTTGNFQPRGPGWQLDRRGNTVGRGMVIQPRITVRGGQNPAYRLFAQINEDRGWGGIP